VRAFPCIGFIFFKKIKTQNPLIYNFLKSFKKIEIVENLKLSNASLGFPNIVKTKVFALMT